MTTEIFGLFDSRKAADRAASDLFGAGFTLSNVKVERYDESPSNRNQPGEDDDQAVVLITTPNSVDGERAIDILDRNGATNII